MFSIQDEKILSYIPNYHINFISPATMSEEEIDKLHSSLREVMLYIKHSKDKEKLTAMVREDERFKNLDRKAVEVINTVTNTRMKFGDDEDDEEECDMCKAIDDLCEEVRENTTLESIKKVMRSLEVSVEKAMDILEISEEDCGKYRSRIQEQ